MRLPPPSLLRARRTSGQKQSNTGYCTTAVRETAPTRLKGEMISGTAPVLRTALWLFLQGYVFSVRVKKSVGKAV